MLEFFLIFRRLFSKMETIKKSHIFRTRSNLLYSKSARSFYCKTSIYFKNYMFIILIFNLFQNELIIYNIDTENMHIITSIPFDKYYWQILHIDYALVKNNLLIYVTALLDINYPELFMISVNIDTIDSVGKLIQI